MLQLLRSFPYNAVCWCRMVPYRGVLHGMPAFAAGGTWNTLVGVASEIYIYLQVSVYVASGGSTSLRGTYFCTAAFLAVNLVHQQYVVKWGCNTGRFHWQLQLSKGPTQAQLYILTCMYELELLRVLRVWSGASYGPVRRSPRHQCTIMVFHATRRGCCLMRAWS
jgi:hypothetical protein